MSAHFVNVCNLLHFILLLLFAFLVQMAWRRRWRDEKQMECLSGQKGPKGEEKEWGSVNWNHILSSKCSEVITNRFLTGSPPVSFSPVLPPFSPLPTKNISTSLPRNDIPGNGTEGKWTGTKKERRILHILNQNAKWRQWQKFKLFSFSLNAYLSNPSADLSLKWSSQ